MGLGWNWGVTLLLGGIGTSGDSGGVGTRFLAPLSNVWARSLTLGVVGGDSWVIGSLAGLVEMGGGGSLFLGAGLGGGFLSTGGGGEAVPLGTDEGGLEAGEGGLSSSASPFAKLTCLSLCFSQAGFSPVSTTFGWNPSGPGTVRGFATGGGLAAGLGLAVGGLGPVGLGAVGLGEGGGLAAVGGGLPSCLKVGEFVTLKSASVRDRVLAFLINSGVSSVWSISR